MFASHYKSLQPNTSSYNTYMVCSMNLRSFTQKPGQDFGHVKTNPTAGHGDIIWSHASAVRPCWYTCSALLSIIMITSLRWHKLPSVAISRVLEMANTITMKNLLDVYFSVLGMSHLLTGTGAGFMAYSAAGHLGAIKIFWTLGSSSCPFLSYRW